MAMLANRAMAAALALAATAVLGFGYPGYTSAYSLVAAKRGQKSVSDYEALINKALACDPDNGLANLEMARYDAKQKKFDSALTFQQRGMEAIRPLDSYEELGYIYDNLAKQDKASSQSEFGRTSRSHFELAVRVHPGNLEALEILMLHAFRDQDDARLESLARQVMLLDRDNHNAIYLRALSAERAGNLRAAYNLLQKISTVQASERRLFFSPTDVRDRLQRLKSTLAATS